MPYKKKFMITKALNFAAYGAFEYFGYFFLLMLLGFLERGLMLITMSLALGVKLLRGFTDYQFSTAEIINSIFSLLSMKVFFAIVGVYSLFMITSGFVSALLTKAGLEIYDTGHITLRNLLVNWQQLLRLIAGMFLYGCMCLLGFLCLIVPGIILSITYGYYRYFIIDKNMRPLEALASSARITQGSRWKIFVPWVILNFFNVIGLYFWGLGLFITLPMYLLAHIYMYRQLAPQQP